MRHLKVSGEPSNFGSYARPGPRGSTLTDSASATLSGGRGTLMAGAWPG
ncbi:hypothetical protein OH805_11265 [Streptomyces sp. NBC_00879]|nr:hypothetical protein OH805_11265 [Streptomyces sp. NBC_00879]